MQPGSSDPGSSYGDPTRATDAERADVCAILDSAYADGELDGDEHRQRCATAMSAKTRGELLGLLTDLQTRPPLFAQRPAPSAEADPNRKWIIGAVLGGVLVAIAAVGFVVLWHGGSTVSTGGPSAAVAAPTAGVAAPSAGVAAPSAGVAAPSAGVAAPSQTFSSDATGTFLPEVDVVGTVSGDFQDDMGHAPEHVSCPGDLAGNVGAFERCSITDNGKRYAADVTVTAVNGNKITTHETIDEVVPPSASPGPPGPPG